MGVVKNIYEKFNWDLTTDAEDNMQAFLKSNPKGKHGVHTYTLENFNLNESIIEEKFETYLSFIRENDLA